MRIKEVLKENGCTQQMLADKMNVSLSAVKQMVSAESLTTSTLEKIATALNVPMWQLFASPVEVTDKSELTALIQYKENFHKADTIEELKKIVAEIEEKHMQDKLKKLEEDKENLTREKTELHIKLQNEISETEKWKAKYEQLLAAQAEKKN